MDIGEVRFALLVGVALLGRLLMFLWRKQPLSGEIAKRSTYFEAMFDCDLCLGVWTYFLLFLLFKIKLIEQVNIAVLNEFLSACVLSFIMWLVGYGWQTAFGSIIITPRSD